MLKANLQFKAPHLTNDAMSKMARPETTTQVHPLGHYAQAIIKNKMDQEYDMLFKKY